MQKVTKAVIAAAGLGSRMYPYTKVESKLMIPVLNKPMVEYLLEELAASGIKEVVIVSNHTAKLKQLFSEDDHLNELLERLNKQNMIKKLHHVEHLCDVELMRQDKPLGWMHEVVFARKHLEKGPFVVCFSDVLYSSKVPAAKQVIDAFYKTGKNVKAAGRFVFKPSVFKIASKEKFKLGEDLADVDVFEKLHEDNDLFTLTLQGKFFDVGNPLSYLKTQTYFGLHNKVFRKEYGSYLKEVMR